VRTGPVDLGARSPTARSSTRIASARAASIGCEPARAPAPRRLWDALTAPLPTRVPRTLLLARPGASLAATCADHAALCGAADQRPCRSRSNRRTKAAARARPGSVLALRVLCAFTEDTAGRPRLAAGRRRRAGAKSSRPPRQAWCSASSSTRAGALDAAAPAATGAARFVYDPADATPDAARAGRGDVPARAIRSRSRSRWRARAFRRQRRAGDRFLRRLLASTSGRTRSPTASRAACPAMRHRASRAGSRSIVASPATLAAGSRLVVEIASASHPRFDRACSTGEEPARVRADAERRRTRRSHHDAQRASCVFVEA
jgi:hypothetical protein